MAPDCILVLAVEFSQAVILPCFTVKFLNLPAQFMAPEDLFRFEFRIGTHESVTWADLLNHTAVAATGMDFLDKQKLHGPQVRIVYFQARQIYIFA